MRHREAWAVEERAPSAGQWEKEKAAGGGPAPAPRPAAKKSAPVVARRPAPAPAAATTPVASEAELSRDILIVASKLKNYIRARSGMNTSDGVMDPLSDCVRAICDKAIRIAGADGRRTVLDRDIRAAARE